MVTIVTRSGKGSALTNTEIDTNFTNLNTGKVEDVPARATYLPSLVLDFANGKSLDPRVSFARSSTATYYDGVTVAKAEENLLLRSQEFNSSPWQVDGVTVTADSAAAPDGTATADIITVGAAVNFKKIVQVTQLSQGLQYTFSVWVLAGTASSVTLYLGGNTVTAATVLSGPATAGSTGSSGCTFSNLSASTWSRIRITVTTAVAGSAEANIYPGNWGAQSIGDSVIAWGAQVEQRSSATAYTPTTTAAISNYVPQLLTAAANTPRFQHDPVTGESLGLLIEEQRTNLFTYSEQFDIAAWVNNGGTVTANALVAPDGTTTADYLVRSTASVDGRYQVIAAGTSGVVTASVYIKKDTSPQSLIWLYDATAVADRLFATVTWSGSTPVITAATGTAATPQDAGNGWWRIAVTSTALTGANTNRLYLLPAYTAASNGQQTAFWGAQLEAGSFATSYIPTVASQVTRNADSASMTGTNFSSWFNPNEGTIYVEADSSVNVTAAQVYNSVSINDGTQSNRHRMFIYNGNWGASEVVGGVNQCDMQRSGSYTAGVLAKSAFGYKVNDFALSVGGTSVLTDTSGSVATPVSQLTIGGSPTDNWLNGRIRRIAYYPERLSNADLQSLTA